MKFVILSALVAVGILSTTKAHAVNRAMPACGNYLFAQQYTYANGSFDYYIYYTGGYRMLHCSGGLCKQSGTCE